MLLAGAQWSISFAAFSRPFDTNTIYTYHKFWANPTRDAVQSYLDFSNRWKVPLLIGETGEYNDAWNQIFRELNERFGIGWCFWPYKSSRHHDCRCFHPEAGGMGLDCRSRQQRRQHAEGDSFAAARPGQSHP